MREMMYISVLMITWSGIASTSYHTMSNHGLTKIIYQCRFHIEDFPKMAPPYIYLEDTLVLLFYILLRVQYDKSCFWHQNYAYVTPVSACTSDAIRYLLQYGFEEYCVPQAGEERNSPLIYSQSPVNHVCLSNIHTGACMQYNLSTPLSPLVFILESG